MKMQLLPLCKGTYPSDPPPPVTSVYISSSYYRFTFISLFILISTLRSDPPSDPPCPIRRTLCKGTYPSDPPSPLPSASDTLRIYVSISLSFNYHFIVYIYFHPPIGSSVGPYHVHTSILRFIFIYRTISIYIISRTFYSLP